MSGCDIRLIIIVLLIAIRICARSNGGDGVAVVLGTTPVNYDYSGRLGDNDISDGYVGSRSGTGDTPNSLRQAKQRTAFPDALFFVSWLMLTWSFTSSNSTQQPWPAP